MKNILVPTTSPSDWRCLLADPEKHWVRGHSAYELAISWESVRDGRGLPREVETVLDSLADTGNSHVLLALPEHQVELRGGGHPSQNDLWVLLLNDSGRTSMAIEAKAGEPFDKYVNDWLKDVNEKPTSGKPDRLSFIKETLNISSEDVNSIRYQLLHRAVSAILEAERFGAKYAIFLVQSFGGPKDDAGFKDFQQFAKLMLASVEKESIGLARRETSVPLFIGWVSSPTADSNKIANTLS